MSVGFHEAVVGVLIDAVADRNGGEVVSDDDRELTLVGGPVTVVGGAVQFERQGDQQALARFSRE